MTVFENQVEVLERFFLYYRLLYQLILLSMGMRNARRD